LLARAPLPEHDPAARIKANDVNVALADVNADR
jgi:hypothetical protein